MSQMFAGKLITMAISVIFAVWDIRCRKAPLFLFAAAFLAGLIYAAVTGRSVSEVFCSAVPGIALLLLSAVTEGGIGTGDGLFFLSVAGFLRPMESVLSLIAAVFLASLAALVLFGMKRDRKASIPFLALMPPALLFVCFC